MKNILVLRCKRGKALHGCHFRCSRYQTPVLDDEGIKKETIKYSIFSFVASTFTPSKEKLKG
jgi:hypothetical protein